MFQIAIDAAIETNPRTMHSGLMIDSADPFLKTVCWTIDQPSYSDTTKFTEYETLG